jgi:RimJ/RimL family protein N-acetyltransferase
MLEILKGNGVQLELLNDAHRNELYAVAQDESIWTYNSHGDRFYRWFDKAVQCLQTKQHLPFAVRRISDKKLIGSTRYYDINSENHRLTIGYTWYIPEVWGSYVNPECKYLLLKYAFEELKTNRVEFVTDSRNSRSRAAIKKMGATEEGILRHHMVLEDGFIRDTVIFSITKPEWPTIKLNLETRLKKLI